DARSNNRTRAPPALERRHQQLPRGQRHKLQVGDAHRGRHVVLPVAAGRVRGRGAVGVGAGGAQVRGLDAQVQRRRRVAGAAGRGDPRAQLAGGGGGDAGGAVGARADGAARDRQRARHVLGRRRQPARGLCAQPAARLRRRRRPHRPLARPPPDRRRQDRPRRLRPRQPRAGPLLQPRRLPRQARRVRHPGPRRERRRPALHARHPVRPHPDRLGLSPHEHPAVLGRRAAAGAVRRRLGAGAVWRGGRRRRHVGRRGHGAGAQARQPRHARRLPEGLPGQLGRHRRRGLRGQGRHAHRPHADLLYAHRPAAVGQHRRRGCALATQGCGISARRRQQGHEVFEVERDWGTDGL
ncbi:hypothetical protein MCOR09_002844, partial [Pyricularia oryzae]